MTEQQAEDGMAHRSGSGDGQEMLLPLMTVPPPGDPRDGREGAGGRERNKGQTAGRRNLVLRRGEVDVRGGREREGETKL